MITSTQTAHLQKRFGFEKALDIIADAGFEGADISLFGMCNPEDIFNTDRYLARAEEIRDYAKKIGLLLTQSHAPFDFHIEKPGEYEDRILPLTARAIEIAGAMGIKNIVVHPLHGLPYYGYEEDWFEKNMRYYRALIPVARACGVRVCVENMWEADARRGCFIDSSCSRPAEFVRYIDALNDEHIGACLDIGHCAVVGENPEIYIRALGKERLAALHTHDNNFKGDYHTIPGNGKINFEEVMKALAEIGYEGDLTLESDVFLRGYPMEFKPQVSKFMASVAHYLAGRYDFYRQNPDADTKLQY